MPELAALLLVAAVVLLIALIGHGIWVVLALLIRGMLGSTKPLRQSPRSGRQYCPGCREALLPTDRDCPHCGLDFVSPLAARLDRVRTAQREVLALADRGELDAATARQVAAQLDRRARDLLAEPSPRQTPESRPATTPIREPAAVDSPRSPQPVAEPVASLPAEPPLQSPRRGVFGAFMEEKNILWGELVGGLLIVGCSIALVLTLWRSLEALPYFPFLLSTGITFALFGAGQYTLHHWKLASTSRGLLVIALLLTPLNLLLLANPGTTTAGEWLDVAVRLVAVGLFVVMVRVAGRDLIGTDLLPGPVDRRWLLALAVVGAPASQALPASWFESGLTFLPVWLPLLCHLAACAAVLRGLARDQREAPPLDRQGHALLMFVGVSLYAALAAWGLSLIRSADISTILTGFALPVALAGVPIAEAGLLVQRRSAGHPGLRATGTGVALAGSMLLFAGVTLAWPDPARLMLVAGLAGLVFTRVAWRDGVPWFHAGGVPALGFAVMLAVHGIAGGWSVPDGVTPGVWLRQLLGTSTSGATLAGFGLVLVAVSEITARCGNREQAVGYAFGGLAAGIAGLFLVTVHGVEEPWPAAAVHAVCAAGLLVAHGRWRVRAVAEAGVWLLLVGTLWTLWAAIPDQRIAWGFVAALESLLLAVVALGLTPSAARPGPVGVVFSQFRTACANVATATAIVAVVLTGTAPGFPEGRWHSWALLVLAPAGLLLARVFARPWPTWAGSATAFLGLAHLTVYTANVRPVTAGLLLAFLGHATAAVLAGLLFRGKRSRERLFADPLRLSARGTSVLAALLVLFPAAGLGLEWTGFAVWLAAVWFVLGWVWREMGAFSATHAALGAAAVLGGLAWAEQQDWWATTSMGHGDPRFLQAVGVALGTLGLVWVTARRFAAGSERLRGLWLRDPFALDRIILGGVVVGQLVLLAVAVEPAARAELTPAGQRSWPTPAAELSHAFGAGTWLVFGLLAAGLVAALRLAPEDDPGTDALLIGLAVLLVSAPVAWAGAFAPQVAAASALRWGLAFAFLVGSSILFAREPLTHTLAGLGFRLRPTSRSTTGCHALLAATAGVVFLLTLSAMDLGLNRLMPSGPLEDSVFAQMGGTASSVIPLALLVLALSATASRERSSGYAFAAGLVFTTAVVGGYALAGVTSGEPFDGPRWARLVMLAVGSVAVWARFWLAAERRVPGGVLLSLQATLGLAGVGLMLAPPLAVLFVNPARPLPAAFAELGGLGWVVLALAGWAGFECANRRAPHRRSHVVGFTAVAAGVLAACAAQPADGPGMAVSFHTMTAVWAAAGLALTAALFSAPAISRGPWVAVLATGLAAAALFGPELPVGAWPVPLGLAAYALLAAGITAALAKGETDTDRWGWLLRAVVIVGMVALLLAVGVAVTGDHTGKRLAGPLAVLLLAVAAGLLVAKAPAWSARGLRIGSMLTAALGVGLVGWAAVEPNAPALWLQRNGWALVALVALAVVGLEALPRVLPDSGWVTDGRWVGGRLAFAAVVMLGVVLVQEVSAFDPVTMRTPLPLSEVLAILAAVAVLMVLALRFAVRPAADPLGLPDDRRTRYVYLAEVLLVVFFVHTRFNLPELFLGQTVRYWTFLVMLLAFVGVGLAELFERRGLWVLAVPLRRTGMLLPLIPLLAFWAKPPGFVIDFAEGSAPGLRPSLGYLETLPQQFDNYAGLWFLAGLLYGLIALSRRSFGWALLGALAVNAGMWSMLAHTGVSAAVHPQVWVIPLALIVLVSEHVNRRALRREVSAGLRYLGIGMLYLSSAADMFLAGVGGSVWLPVVLAVLCVAGVAAGIVLRVRAFLFLGTGFLLLDVFAMLWHAAVDRAQTWVWYASGIVLGAVILALFALLEKRRNEVHQVVERIRQWD
jgi:hypothetical protein